MSTPIEDGDLDMRYAEYVLGVLDADTRAQVAREVLTSDEAASAVALWERRILPLSEEIIPHAVPAYVWARIRAELQLDAQGNSRGAVPRPGLWDSLRFWHWLGMSATALALVASLLLAQLLSHLSKVPVPPSIPYMASTLTQTDGRVGWTATMDIERARMIVVPAAPGAIELGRAPELWLIPEGEKPISVGMIAVNAPTTLRLGHALLTRLGPSATLAVSVEPTGGSPTGQPTGPVIAQGAIGAAADTGGAHVAVLRKPGPGGHAA